MTLITGPHIEDAKLMQAFLKHHNINYIEFAALIGLTSTAIDHWTRGKRSIHVPFKRLMRLFDKNPALMREFPNAS
jgi:hypothetical protein